MDADGEPTVDPEKAWHGQLLPIGRYKGVGLAMVFEVLSSVLSGSRFAVDVPSIVTDPHEPAGTGVFMMVIDPETIMPGGLFEGAMKQYVEYVESSTPRNADDPPRYPGRREGENWADRRSNGIPLSQEQLDCLGEIAGQLDLEVPVA